MDSILLKLRKEAIVTLGENLVCLLHHGSRAKGEASPESDYDIIIIVKKIDEETLGTIRNVIKSFPRLSTYLLSVDELKTLPRAHLLEFVYAKPLYGKISVERPTSDEVRQYVSHIRRDELHMVRHYLLHPHPLKKKAKHVYYGLKSAYIYLSFLAFSESGELPATRKETIAYFKDKKPFKNGVKLLQILDEWNIHKDKAMKNPDAYLLMMERFLRNVLP